MKRSAMYGLYALLPFCCYGSQVVAEVLQPQPMEQQTVVYDRISAHASHALVCVDRNNNQTCDPGEPYTRTRQDGRFNMDDLLLKPNDTAQILIVTEGDVRVVMASDDYYKQRQEAVVQHALEQSRLDVANGKDVNESVNKALDEISDAVFANQARINEKLNAVTQISDDPQVAIQLPPNSADVTRIDAQVADITDQADLLQSHINDTTETVIPMPPVESAVPRRVASNPLSNAQASVHCDLNFDAHCDGGQ